MALKRSGVRASFAPSYSKVFPRIRRFGSLSACSVLTRVQILLWLACLLVVAPCRAQQSPTKAGSNSQTDVFLFVRQSSPTTARIGLSYGKKIPHGRVEIEIKKLLTVSGWKLSGTPSISDETMRPDDPKRFPPKTGAEFEVADAPQFHDNAPTLAPYLKAFQSWDHLEILFATTDLVPYNGVTSFRSPALDVTLEKSDGIYDYRVTIRDHSGELPALIPDRASAGANVGTTTPTGTAAQLPRSSVASTETNSTSSFWPYALIIVGGVLAGGVGIYLFAKRQQENLKPRRTR